MTEAALKQEKTATALAKAELRTGGQIAALVPQDAEQAYRMAQMIFNSGIAPRDMSTPEKIVTAIFHGLEIGLKPLQAVQSIAIVNGRPCIWGDAAMGLVQGSGLVEDFEERIDGQGDKMVASCRIKRQGVPHAVERTFSVADAVAAGLWNKAGPWKQYPKRMLQMRARSWALRDGFADVLKGLQVHEEVRDYNVVTGATVTMPTVSADALREQAGITDADAEIIEGDDDAPTHETDDQETGEQAVPVSAHASIDEPADPESEAIAALLDDIARLDDIAELAQWWVSEATQGKLRTMTDVERATALRAYNARVGALNVPKKGKR